MKTSHVAGIAPLLLIAALAGCAGTPGGAGQEPTVESESIIGEVGDPRNRARANTNLAAEYYERGTFGVALEVLRNAVAADPGYAPAHGLFGLIYMELRENALAQQSFERALRISPNDPDINHNYGWFLCQTGREKESIARFMQALRNPLYQTPWRSWSTAGQCMLRVGNVKEGEEFLQRALKLEPDDPGALIHMAQIRFRQNALEEARRMVLRYNRLVEPTAESLWLAMRIERRLGQRAAEQSFATQLRRRFPDSSEFRALQRGEFD